jgi:tetratricopeptide (TPR) repeat protein
MLNERGNVYFTKGKYDRAIQDYDQAIRLDPRNSLAFGNRAAAYGEKGEYDRAFQDFDQAIRLDPNYAEAFYNRGSVELNIGDYNRAIRDFDQAIRLKPRGSSHRHKALSRENLLPTPAMRIKDYFRSQREQVSGKAGI